MQMMAAKLLKWVQFIRTITPSVSPHDHGNDPFYQAAVWLNAPRESKRIGLHSSKAEIATVSSSVTTINLDFSGGLGLIPLHPLPF